MSSPLGPLTVTTLFLATIVTEGRQSKSSLCEGWLHLTFIWSSDSLGAEDCLHGVPLFTALIKMEKREW